MTSRVVVDTNIIFSALLHRRSRQREMLALSTVKFHAPRFTFVELFKHKERIKAGSDLTEEELLEALNVVINRLILVDESEIAIGTWMEARRLCGGIDLKDSPFVALALHLDALLWTDDDALQNGLAARGFDRFFTTENK
jgi:predicted nucleic acid-binding protein